eukprot:TRINITY_DN11642_c0_g1_i1.p1 TRINITY_DN11642_c0_g1~~TRINITY_DN11642_c0_g1_i1.p1  ORF type:complete len:147 (+),score=51.36 TRINITY_DN11642_c0_g1_i1:165-605(+)
MCIRDRYGDKAVKTRAEPLCTEWQKALDGSERAQKKMATASARFAESNFAWSEEMKGWVGNFLFKYQGVATQTEMGHSPLFLSIVSEDPTLMAHFIRLLRRSLDADTLEGIAERSGVAEFPEGEASLSADQVKALVGWYTNKQVEL